MLKNFFKGFGIALLAMVVFALFWWVIKLLVDVTVAALGFVAGIFAPWVLILLIAIVAGIWYMNKHKDEEVVIINH